MSREALGRVSRCFQNGLELGVGKGWWERRGSALEGVIDAFEGLFGAHDAVRGLLRDFKSIICNKPKALVKNPWWPSFRQLKRS